VLRCRFRELRDGFIYGRFVTQYRVLTRSSDRYRMGWIKDLNAFLLDGNYGIFCFLVLLRQAYF